MGTCWRIIVDKTQREVLVSRGRLHCSKKAVLFHFEKRRVTIEEQISTTWQKCAPTHNWVLIGFTSTKKKMGSTSKNWNLSRKPSKNNILKTVSKTTWQKSQTKRNSFPLLDEQTYFVKWVISCGLNWASKPRSKFSPWLDFCSDPTPKVFRFD